MSQRATLAGRRVLVLEGEYFVADDLTRVLNMAGAIVVGPFATIEAALQALAREPGIDLGVLDLNVRGDRSYPVAEALAARGVPFVFVTGYDSPAIEARWAETPRCCKPFDPRQLLRTLAA